MSTPRQDEESREKEPRAQRREARREAKREAKRQDKRQAKRSGRKQGGGSTAGPGTIFDDTTSAPTGGSTGGSGTVVGATPPPAPQGFWRTWTPLVLIRAAHPRQAVLTALGMAVAAALSGRDTRELGLVFATVLVGQVILGWHNDLVDEPVDLAHGRTGKPVADGRLEAGTLWFVLCCAVLLVIPLAVSNGIVAGVAYLASVAIGILGNVVLRRGLLSFLPWAASFAAYPFFLSHGGWGGGWSGSPPETLMVVLAALLGIGVHFLTALWGLVADHEDRWAYLPLKLGLRMGATRLLILTLLYCAALVAALLYTGHTVGLSR